MPFCVCMDSRTLRQVLFSSRDLCPSALHGCGVYNVLGTLVCDACSCRPLWAHQGVAWGALESFACLWPVRYSHAFWLCVCDLPGCPCVPSCPWLSCVVAHAPCPISLPGPQLGVGSPTADTELPVSQSCGSFASTWLSDSSFLTGALIMQSVRLPPSSLL